MSKMKNADPERLRKDVEFLCRLHPPRNHSNLISLNKAAKYIQFGFQNTGLVTGLQHWRTSGNIYSNILAAYQPEKQRRLILGAHYDVYGDFPGADDNASGVAGLLETARIVTKLLPEIDYRIDFVAYSLEEPPFFGRKEMGSYVHAESLFEQKADVIGMICYEMIGHYSADGNTKRHFPSEVDIEFPENSNNFVGAISIKKYESFNRQFFEWTKEENPHRVGFVSFPDDTHGPSLSDNRNYWRFGYPALMLNSGPSGRNPNYHQATDTPNTLNYEVMAEVVTAITGACLRF